MKNKHIIALACSPSKGWNSDTLLDQFIAGFNEIATTENGLTVEKLYLADLPLKDWDFAHKTPKVEEEPEFVALVEKIKAASGLIIATPTYNFNVPGKLKNLFDRLSFQALDYQKLNKLKQPTGQWHYLKIFTISSSGSPVWIQKLLYFWYPRSWFKAILWYFDADYVGHISGGGYSKDFQAKDDIKTLQRCRLAGMAYAQQLLN